MQSVKVFLQQLILSEALVIFRSQFFLTKQSSQIESLDKVILRKRSAFGYSYL